MDCSCPAAKLYTATHSSPMSQWDSGENRKAESEKLMGQDKDSLISESEPVHIHVS